MILRVSSSAVCFAVLMNAECRETTQPKYGRVEIVAATAVGERLPHAQFELVERGSHKRVASGEDVAAKVAYGEYMVRISSPGFRSMERTLRLQQPDTVLRVELPVSVECGGYSSVQGTVQPSAPTDELWVKVIALRGTHGSEAPVGKYGNFLIAGLDSGTYLLLVLKGTSVVHSRTVEVFGDEALTIQLTQQR